MTKLYQKDPLFFALACICVYVCTFSASESVSARLGAPFLFTVPAGVVLCLVLGGWIRRQGLAKFLGLCRFRGTAGQYLCFLPLMVPAGCNLWHGVQWNFPPLDTFIYILSMLLAGFLEEVLFRGLLFKAIAKDNIKSAIVISSVTFGVGHIINLFNGSGMDLVDNLCQIVFAIAVGFLLVTIFYRGGSLLPCIIVHAAINTLSTFANDTNLTAEMHLLHLVVLIAVTVVYTLILTRTLPQKQWKEGCKNE